MLFVHEKFTGTNVYHVPLGMILGDRKHPVFWAVKWEHLRDCGRIPIEHGTLSMSALLRCSMLCKKTRTLKKLEDKAFNGQSHDKSEKPQPPWFRHAKCIEQGQRLAHSGPLLAGSVSCSYKWEPVQDCAERHQSVQCLLR